MTDIHYLLIRRRHLDSDAAAAQARLLAEKCGVDPYNARLALVGEGLAALRNGDPDALRAAGPTLTELGYQWRVASPPPRNWAPQTIHRFREEGDGLVFEGGGPTRELRRGATVLAVLAGLQGDLLTKLTRKATFHAGPSSPLGDDEKYHEIMTHGPVLDLYIAGDGGAAPTPLRVAPGHFDPHSLGDRAAVDGKRNLHETLALIRKFAGRLDLDLNFGLAQLPDCLFDHAQTADAAAHNLKSLALYGWWTAQFLRPGDGPVPEAAPAAVLPSLTAPAAAMFTRPVAHAPATNFAPAILADLPPPPPPKHPAWVLDRYNILVAYVIGCCGLAALTMFSDLSSTLAARVLHRALINGGGLYFALAAAAFYEFTRFLRLKRYIDDMPESKARSAAMGMVELRGVCERACNLTTPLTQAPCVYFRYDRYSVDEGPRGEQGWQRIGTLISGDAPFYLRDETGRVLIDPAGADFRATNQQMLFREAAMATGQTLPLPPTERYELNFIPEGAPVLVVGFAGPRPIADRRTPQEEAERTKSQSEQMVVGRPPLRGLPFVVSTSTENYLAMNYGIISVLFLAGTLAATAAGVWAAMN
jgi:hypothetical protein